MARLLAAVTVAWLSAATPAVAHGPVNPSASSFLATVRQVPTGVRAIVVDGDQRMWMSVAPDRRVVVLDYQGRPYLRFTRAGVAVNDNSSMYYLNQVPPEPVPNRVGRPAPPHWALVSHGHSYDWHDGRLHALAGTAITSGASYLGSWAIPLDLGGRPARLMGGVRYAPAPSLVWFWPILVALACVLAGLRVRRPELDLRLAQAAAAVALVGVAVAGAGEQLHGRPGVAVSQYFLLAVLAAFVIWGVKRLHSGRDGWLGYFLIALVALWQGGSLVGVLTHGFVLIALPAAVARAAVIGCLAAGIALLPVVFRLAERPEAAGGRVTAGTASGLGQVGLDEPQCDELD